MVRLGFIFFFDFCVFDRFVCGIFVCGIFVCGVFVLFCGVFVCGIFVCGVGVFVLFFFFLLKVQHVPTHPSFSLLSYVSIYAYLDQFLLYHNLRTLSNALRRKGRLRSPAVASILYIYSV